MDEILQQDQAVQGLVLLDPEVMQKLAARVRPMNGFTSISLRVKLKGLGNREMASRLGISDHTVKVHVSPRELGAATPY